MNSATDIFCHSNALANSWHAVALSAGLTSGPLAVHLLGRRYVFWRSPEDGVVALPDRCPHREAPLSAGCIVEGQLTCRYHGWRFNTQGRCVHIPSVGPDATIPPKAHLSTLHTTEQYGLIWLCPGQPAAAIPHIPQEAAPTFQRINTPVDIWRVSATRMVDNFLDIAHIPFVHWGTIGSSTDEVVPNITLEQLDDDFFGYRYEVKVDNPAQAAATSGMASSVLTRQMSSGFSLPFTCRSTIRYETGLEHMLLLLSTPIDDVTSYFTFVVWRNDDFSVPAGEIISFDLAIGAEDKAMLEQIDGVLPLDPTQTANVAADKPSVAWRRRFAAFVMSDSTPQAVKDSDHS